MKMGKWLTLLLAFLMLFTLGTFVGCEDSEDDDDDDGSNSVLVGSWYRYSFMAGSTNVFFQAKTVINSNGSGTTYTYDLVDGDVIPSTDYFTWTDNDNVMTIYNEDGDVEFSGSFTSTSGGTVITTTYQEDGISMAETSVRECTGHEAGMVGTWQGVTYTLNGQAESIANWEFTFNEDGTYTFTGWGETDAGEWATDGAYFLGVSDDDPMGRGYGLYQYTLSNNDSTVTLTGYEGEIDEDSGYPESYAVQLVFTKGTGGGVVVDTDLVGTWHTYSYDLYDGSTNTRLNIPTKEVLSDDGTGVRVTIDDGNLETENFTWTANNNSITVYDSDGNVEFSGTYQISNNVVTTSFEDEWTDGETYTITVTSVKETGDIDVNVPGDYVPSTYKIDDVLYYYEEYVVFNDDGTGSSTYIDGDTGVSQDVTWSTNGLYMILYTEDLQGLAYVLQYDWYTDGLLDINYYYEDARVTSQYVENTGELDTRLVGSWYLTARTINNEDDPDMPDDATFILDADGNATGEWDGETYAFTMTTNEGWMLQFPTEYDVTVGTAYSYTVSGDALVVHYREEDGADGSYIVESWARLQ